MRYMLICVLVWYCKCFCCCSLITIITKAVQVLVIADQSMYSVAIMSTSHVNRSFNYYIDIRTGCSHIGLPGLGSNKSIDDLCRLQSDYLLV